MLANIVATTIVDNTLLSRLIVGSIFNLNFKIGSN